MSRFTCHRSASADTLFSVPSGISPPTRGDTMAKGLGLAAAAAVLAMAGLGSTPAWADHTPGGSAATWSPAGTSPALPAEMHKFDKDCLAVTAGESFTLRFANRDADRHNVA